jgi:sterol desaturase/sphingolipid hydroxylase (fatty acid hydroxylase superfamily)/tetratricopeptide (TPR) repeat protein
LKQKVKAMSTYQIITTIVLISCIMLEAYLSARENMGLYNKKDSIANFKIGILGVFVNLVVKGFMLTFYLNLGSYAIFDFGNSLLSWIALFLMADFHHFLFHWLGHRSRFFWAMHVIHHSSPHYNFTTAIRTPFTNSVIRHLTLTPIVLIGFDPVMLMLIDSLIVTFNFFQHTEMVGKLGWLEYIFNTPSHHRVHHASDEKYLDKNFGAVLIIWDKLFGTFQQEEEHPTYGITKPLNSHNIATIIFHEWIAIWHDVRKAKNLREALGYIFAAPGWTPATTTKKLKSLPAANWHPKAASIMFFLLALPSAVAGQPVETLMAAGIAEEQSRNEVHALKLYRQVIQLEPNHSDALIHASRMISNQAGRSQSKEDKRRFAIEAGELALQALAVSPDNTEALLAHCISFGLQSEVAYSPSEKLRHAKLIQHEAETMLSIDPNFAPACYILGKWHFELSRLNWAEKLACNLLFGGVPKGASFGQALNYFERAIALQPDFILFHYGKATALYHAGKYDLVVATLEKALRLPDSDPDDAIRRHKCRYLLSESRQHITKA